ncbi:MAG: glycoside hydrolase family 5 protein [Xanthomonadales bacterium]|nr:glycoside hydrolase family 5 protein [Xanthomonadales bacterium]
MAALVVATVLLGAPYASAGQQHATLRLEGVNLSGAAFGGNIPGSYGTDYIWPNADELAYFHAKGMNVVRVPFRWERLQPTLNGPLNSAELARMQSFVSAADALGMRSILDPHNYARYNGQVIGSGSVSNAAFADFWSRLATVFRNDPHVIFGLMNEPHDMPTSDWLNAANAAIAAIRAAGASQLVLVPGNAWTGAYSWEQTWYGAANASVMDGVVDPGNHYAYELHQYLDSDYSGTQTACVHDAATLHDVTAWLRAHAARGFLGEFAGANNAACQADVTSVLSYMAANSQRTGSGALTCYRPSARTAPDPVFVPDIVARSSRAWRAPTDFCVVCALRTMDGCG